MITRFLPVVTHRLLALAAVADRAVISVAVVALPLLMGAIALRVA